MCSELPTGSGEDPGARPLPGTDFSTGDSEGAQAGSAPVGGAEDAQNNHSLPGADLHHSDGADGYAGGANESPAGANFSGADGSGGSDVAAAAGM
jgi:hypothetical protein